MNDVYTVLTGVIMHAYEIAIFVAVITIPGTMIMRALHSRSPI